MATGTNAAAIRQKFNALDSAALCVLKVVCLLEDGGVDDSRGVDEHILLSGIDRLNELRQRRPDYAPRHVDYPMEYPQSAGQYRTARDVLLKARFLCWCPGSKSHLKIADTIVPDLHTYVLDKMVSRVWYSTDAFNAAAVLLCEVWSFVDSNTCNDMHYLAQNKPYLAYVRRLAGKYYLLSNLAWRFEPNTEVCALLNETAWHDISELNFNDKPNTASIISISRSILYGESNYESIEERGLKEQSELDRLLSDTFRYEGIAQSYRGEYSEAMLTLRTWFDLLLQRIVRFRHPEDYRALPIAYTEIAVASMGESGGLQFQTARPLLARACKLLQQGMNPGLLGCPQPFFYLALVAAYFEHDLTRAQGILALVVKNWALQGVEDLDCCERIEACMLLLYMGNINFLQGNIDAAHDQHSRALLMLRKLDIRDIKHSVWLCTVYYRLAVDKFSQCQYQDAKDILIDILKMENSEYCDSAILRPQLARAAWKCGRACLAMGGMQHSEMGFELLDKAMRTRRLILPNEECFEPDLVDEDWDKLVLFILR